MPRGRTELGRRVAASVRRNWARNELAPTHRGSRNPRTWYVARTRFAHCDGAGRRTRYVSYGARCRRATLGAGLDPLERRERSPYLRVGGAGEHVLGEHAQSGRQPYRVLAPEGHLLRLGQMPGTGLQRGERGVVRVDVALEIGGHLRAVRPIVAGDVRERVDEGDEVAAEIAVTGGRGGRA